MELVEIQINTESLVVVNTDLYKRSQYPEKTTWHIQKEVEGYKVWEDVEVGAGKEFTDMLEDNFKQMIKKVKDESSGGDSFNPNKKKESD